MGRSSVNNSYAEGLWNYAGVTTTYLQQRAHKYTELWLWLSSGDSINQSMPSQPFRQGDNTILNWLSVLSTAGRSWNWTQQVSSDMEISLQCCNLLTVWACVYHHHLSNDKWLHFFSITLHLSLGIMYMPSDSQWSLSSWKSCFIKTSASLKLLWSQYLRDGDGLPIMGAIQPKVIIYD